MTTCDGCSKHGWSPDCDSEWIPRTSFRRRCWWLAVELTTIFTVDRQPSDFGYAEKRWKGWSTRGVSISRRKKRAIDREAPLTDASSLAIARQLISERPSVAAMRQELGSQVRDAMLTLSESDREILILRNAEHLTNIEVAQLLEIDQKTASKRYGRAIHRLSEQLSQMGVSR